MWHFEKVTTKMAFPPRTIWTHNPLKWPKIPYFQKSSSWSYFFFKSMCCGYSCTSRFLTICWIKFGQNLPVWLFFWHFGRLLRTKWTHWPDSFKILLGHLEPHYPFYGIHNLCQKMPDNILKESYQYVHLFQSKRPKCQKNIKNGQYVFSV